MSVVVGDVVADVVGVVVTVVVRVVVGDVVTVVVGDVVNVVVGVVVTVVIWHCVNTPSSNARIAPLRNCTSDAHSVELGSSRKPSRVHPMVPVVMIGNANSSTIRLNVVNASGLHDVECNAGNPLGSVWHVTLGGDPLPV